MKRVKGLLLIGLSAFAFSIMSLLADLATLEGVPTMLIVGVRGICMYTHTHSHTHIAGHDSGGPVMMAHKHTHTHTHGADAFVMTHTYLHTDAVF